MKKILFIVCLILINSFSVLAQTEKIEFWNIQQKGTNFFNANPTKEWFESAAKANIKFVRFTFAKWESEQRDFLLGAADNYLSDCIDIFNEKK